LIPTREREQDEKRRSFAPALGNALRPGQRLKALRLETKAVGCEAAEADMEVIKRKAPAKEKKKVQ
jgi:hypothetical protein